MTEISMKDARRLFLDQQGLLRSSPYGRGKGAVVKAIRQLGYVQIDTISVVDRAHHHVLKSRVPNYREQMLDRLLADDRQVFEYWAHAAAYLPIEDYRFYLPMMRGWASRELGDVALSREILARIRDEGPLQSRDFEDTRPDSKNGWWDWKPAKLTLEHLFLGGEIMVARRDGFQKVFDIPERVLPPDIDTRVPGQDEWLRFVALRWLRGAGLGRLNDVAYARTAIRKFTGVAPRKLIEHALAELIEEGLVMSTTIGGETWYVDRVAADNLPGRLGRRQFHILSPFDNAVINRDRLSTLFGYDYQIECYVPAARRIYGYFCLPMLWGDQFIGRLDGKAVRDKGVFEIRGLFLEPGVRVTDALTAALTDGIATFAERLGCDSVRVLRTEPKLELNFGSAS